MKGVFLILTGILAVIGYIEVVTWRARGCDACRVESWGGSRVLIPHTCWPWRALHRDSKGDVREFGKIVRFGGDAGK